jgi:chaperonin GroEL (HSP60 family)
VLGRRRFVTLESNTADRSISTLILAAPEQHTLDELEAVVKAAVRVLSGAVAGKGVAWVLAGAGQTETYLAEVLRSRSGDTDTEHEPREVRAVLDNFAMCLEQCINVGGICHREQSCGWDIVDSFEAKSSAISTAVEVANTLLRIDRMVENPI